jgi:hypothetical protein
MQQRTRFCCEGCGHVPTTPEMTYFAEGEEHDPEFPFHKIDLSTLQYNVDYIITEYP